MNSVLVATRAITSFNVITHALGNGCRVEQASSLTACFARFQKLMPGLIFIDIKLIRPQQPRTLPSDYRRVFRPFHQLIPSLAIIVLAAHSEVSEAISAVKGGATRYLTTPLNPEEVCRTVESIDGCSSLSSQRYYPHDQFLDGDSQRMLKTDSPEMFAVLEKVRMVAPTSTAVLLTGETGTGKGVVAQLIHERSMRSEGKFISVHCGAVPESLIESELFGHERGAFTGAIRRKLGQFEMASGGTIFLDEIGTVTVATQIKLLQVLQDQTIHPVGAERPVFCDVRVIAASNIDLEAMCRQGEFRTDLYYRLNVFPIYIPPLRSHSKDIPLFIEFFIKRFNTLNRRNITNVSPEVMRALQQYHWPGNIRELENLIQRAFIIETSSELTKKAFPQELFFEHETEKDSNAWPTLADIRRQAKEESEQQYLRSLLTETKGRINQAADLAGISRRQIHKLLTRYGIRKEDFKNQSGPENSNLT